MQTDDIDQIDEFAAGFHGDCGEYVTLAALHAMSPDHYAMDASELGAVVREAIAAGRADGTGAEPLSAIAAQLTSYYGCRVSVVPFAQPFDTAYLPILQEHAGLHAVILELANAGPALEGNAVHYHFIVQLAEYLQFADGDHKPALVNYTEAQLEAAQVCGIIIVLATYDQMHPVSQLPGMSAYTVQDGDTLAGIAAHLHLPNWYQDLYKPNQDTIEAVARARGLQGSNGGALIFAGTVLHYRPL